MKKFFALLFFALATPAIAADTADRNINIVFDKSKGSIYAVYARALREKPGLSGKLVVSFDIATTGNVTDCRVRSSTLGSPELDRNICDKIRLMKFAPRRSAFTATKTIDFFPAA
jgi:periplasmic protein TonB